MSIAEIAGSVRRARRIPQTVVASRTGEAASNLSVIENGRRSPRADKLDSILRASDARLAAIPTIRPGALESSAAIRRELLGSDASAAFRAWLTYNDALAAEDAVNRVVLAAFPPEPTGSSLFDAALAAITEYRLSETRSPIPPWVAEAPTLDEPTIFAGSRYVTHVAAEEVPDAFLRRGVLIPEATLRSV
ncbi:MULTISPECIES: helix-turn-helix domain-containing protein [Microbacteriaceae]|uniref:helix-turn-helix domain-containing protein n=1 Tax=Microbacteriaceae TaxID=85023 RepID=UPI00035CF955|nr:MULTISPECIES: helix-turn-helix transcriptional regulator [Microbacteriaceae]TDQ03446.1 hypothetical protein AXZ95_1736 [Leifsonia sp. 115AMFTsu3.1]